jgi:hypothetical protein
VHEQLVAEDAAVNGLVPLLSNNEVERPADVGTRHWLGGRRGNVSQTPETDRLSSHRHAFRDLDEVEDARAESTHRAQAR